MKTRTLIQLVFLLVTVVPTVDTVFKLVNDSMKKLHRAIFTMIQLMFLKHKMRHAKIIISIQRSQKVFFSDPKMLPESQLGLLLSK